jgi:excisionase family DNA binding protein
MAGMFYSLKEAAEKLNKTEDEIQEIIKQGKLREFRDGPNLLLKVDEVDSLAKKPQGDEQSQGEEEITLDDTSQPSDNDSEQGGSDDFDQELEIALDEEDEKAEEKPGLQQQQEDADEKESEDEPELQLAQDTDTGTEFDLDADSEETDDKSGSETEEEIQLEDSSIPDVSESEKDDTGEDTIAAQPQAEQKEQESDDQDLDDELILADDDEESEEPSETEKKEESSAEDLDTDSLEDTSDESGEDLLMSDSGTDTGTGQEQSLEEIEDDVNLDSFGSGSGLLDLSLQADDTSLGGVLDEIYAPEGQQDQQEGNIEDVAAETEQMFPDQQGVAAPVAAAAVEPPPDAMSKAFGSSLFLPLVAIIYTSIVITASISDTAVSILAPIESYIWYIFGGLFVVSLLIIGLPAVMSGEGSKKPKKTKKEGKKKKKDKKKKK